MLFFVSTDSQNRSQAAGFIEAAVLSTVSDNTNPTVNVLNEAGIKAPVSASSLLEGGIAGQIALSTLLIFAGCALFSILCWLAIKHLINRTPASNNDIELDDANNKIIEGEELRLQAMAVPCTSRLSFAGIPLPRKQDTANLMIVGSTGAGKTCSIKEVLGSIRNAEKKALVYDRDGELLSHFYRPDKDIILSSNDVRSASWDIWCECVSHQDYQRMTSLLMPENELENKYLPASRLVLIHLAKALADENNNTLASLTEAVEELNTHKIYNILKNTSEAALASDHDEKTTVSIRGHLMSCIETMKEAPTEGARFSVRRWAFNETNDSWLFITSPNDDMDSQRPLKTLWMEFAANTLSNLNPDPVRRFFYVVDDICTLNKISSLENLMLLSRKLGVSSVLTITSSSRLNSIYKKETVQTLSRACDNWVALYCDDEHTSQWISRRLGFKQAIEKTEISLRHLKDTENENTLISEKRIACPVVTTEMIAALGPMQGYLRFSKSYPIARFNNVPKSWPDVAPSFLTKSEKDTIEQLGDNITPAQNSAESFSEAGSTAPQAA